MGLSGVKDSLRKTGEPYGIDLPLPPIINLALYIVDIPGYTKSQVVEGSGKGFEPDISAKYTKKVGESVTIEIFKQDTSADAIKWAEQTMFATGIESRDWSKTNFLGYPGTIKKITIPVSDNMNQEVYLRVAVGDLGIFTKFTQSVRKSDASLLLVPQDQAVAMVEEITGTIIREIEVSQ